ncbi:MAG: Bifunctional protein GlmU [Parcubacteria group bacterium GW2011_GWB1_43_6]|nr:MAG: Bifunctional protein GlmU [Parcubacteria group bacterium GW2011_GWB1_43_6]
MAAGESSRFWPLNYQNKSLFKIMGKPLIWHTVEGLRKAGIKEVIIIQGPEKDIEDGLKNYDLGDRVKYLVQETPQGMGDALMSAQKLISEPFLVVGGHKVDAGDYLSEMTKKDKEVILLGVRTSQPWHYGILKIAGDKVVDLVEKPEKGKEPSNLKLGAIYLLPPTFFEYHQRLPKDHYSFEQVLKLYIQEERVGLVETREDFSSLKHSWQLFSLVKYLLDKNLGDQKVHVGKNTKIFEGAIIKGPCYIGDNCVVGNNALVRDYTNLEDGSVVGAQAEVVRCVFQKNAHVHSGFFGDSILGENCRVGAGTVTGNIRLDRGVIKETGLNSLGAIVGNNTHIGINVSLMPGVLIGSNCVVGPGSVVFDNIEDDTAFYTKFDNVLERKK